MSRANDSMSRRRARQLRPRRRRPRRCPRLCHHRDRLLDDDEQRSLGRDRRHARGDDRNDARGDGNVRGAPVGRRHPAGCGHRRVLRPPRRGRGFGGLRDCGRADRGRRLHGHGSDELRADRPHLRGRCGLAVVDVDERLRRSAGEGGADHRVYVHRAVGREGGRGDVRGECDGRRVGLPGDVLDRSEHCGCLLDRRVDGELHGGRHLHRYREPGGEHGLRARGPGATIVHRREGRPGARAHVHRAVGREGGRGDVRGDCDGRRVGLPGDVLDRSEHCGCLLGRAGRR